MSVFVNREGDISIFRVGLFLLAIGLIIGIGGFIFFQIEQNRFNSPLNVDLYEGAVEYGISTRGNSERVVIYTISNATVEEVMDYYDREMADFYGVDADDLEDMLRRPNEEKCQRFPSNDTFEDHVEGTGTVPYYFSCMFSDSQYDSSRSTQVRIMPGLLREVDGEVMENTLGMTRVEYVQEWE